mmetsp:Transcript_39843/g.106354  ORF Transcript_39843/g.106354 Transcript_39843/m.106354 type:complete len:147 (+) Transcript_39843:619-1059(+)
MVPRMLSTKKVQVLLTTMLMLALLSPQRWYGSERLYLSPMTFRLNIRYRTQLSKGGMRAAPHWSFGLKPSVGGVYSAVNKTSPGPGTYDLPNRRGLAFSMTPRNPVKGGFVTPGPGKARISFGKSLVLDVCILFHFCQVLMIFNMD